MKRFTWVTESGRFPSSMAVALSVQIVGTIVRMGLSRSQPLKLNLFLYGSELI